MTATNRRLVVLLTAADGADMREEALAEAKHLTAALGRGVVAVAVRLRASVNPLAQTGVTTGVDAAIEVDLAERATPDALRGALAGLADRHPGLLDLERSTVLVGEAFTLRLRPEPPPSAEALRVVVAVRPAPGMSITESRAGWREVGAVNARTHPSCSEYVQVHSDVELTSELVAQAGLTGDPFPGLAVEVFPTPDDLVTGHHSVLQPESVAGSSLDGKHLMEMLARYLDFGTALMIVAAQEPVGP